MKIYCCGIGGIGLSGYAALQKAAGHDISGSDRTKKEVTDDLEEQGIGVVFNQDGSAIPKDADLFVYSEAIPEDASERVQAKKYSIPQLSYFEALGELSKEYEEVIAVCGTHGKSTTTAMAAKVLIDLDKDPTVIVGTKVPQMDGRNWRRGSKKLLLLEACEYRGSFLSLKPNVVLMTNVDWDHVDAFPSYEDYQNIYIQFLGQLSENSVIITHMQDSQCVELLTKVNIPNIIDADQVSRTAFSLRLPGQHMTENATLVFALCDSYFGCDTNIIGGSLGDFRGSWRRMEEKGFTEHGALVIDDYAHHPEEIMATIAGIIEKYCSGENTRRRLFCLFQPHMFDRTDQFYDKFTKSFCGNGVLLLDVYGARGEKGSQSRDMKKFASDIQDASKTNCEYVGSFENARKILDEILQPNDVLLCMGAGDDLTAFAGRMVGEK